MPIFEFKCNNCFTIFEEFVFKDNCENIKCFSCGGVLLERPVKTSFSPHKAFCPKKRNLKKGELEKKDLKQRLRDAVLKENGKCKGCRRGMKF